AIASLRFGNADTALQARADPVPDGPAHRVGRAGIEELTDGPLEPPRGRPQRHVPRTARPALAAHSPTTRVGAYRGRTHRVLRVRELADVAARSGMGCRPQIGTDRRGRPRSLSGEGTRRQFSAGVPLADDRGG